MQGSIGSQHTSGSSLGQWPPAGADVLHQQLQGGQLPAALFQRASALPPQRTPSLNMLSGSESAGGFGSENAGFGSKGAGVTSFDGDGGRFRTLSQPPPSRASPATSSEAQGSSPLAPQRQRTKRRAPVRGKRALKPSAAAALAAAKAAGGPPPRLRNPRGPGSQRGAGGGATTGGGAGGRGGGAVPEAGVPSGAAAGGEGSEGGQLSAAATFGQLHAVLQAAQARVEAAREGEHGQALRCSTCCFAES